MKTRRGLLVLVLLACHGTANAAGESGVTIAPSPALRALAVSGLNPLVIEPIANMTLHAGDTADQTVRATDADGDPLTFSKNDGPSYMTVTTTDPGSGSATGNIHLAPGSTGDWIVAGTVVVSDGVNNRYKNVIISVVPFLQPIATMTVDEGATADQTLIASDLGRTVSFTFPGGPPFVTVTSTGDSTAVLHVAPADGDAGQYGGTVTISDGTSSYAQPVNVWVTNPRVLAQPSDMHGVPGTITEQGLYAAPGPVGLRFSKVSGPDYMTVGDMGNARGYVRLTPSMADTGEVLVTVRVSSPVLISDKSFRVRVDLRNSAPTLSMQNVTVDEGESFQESILGIDPDGQRLSISATQMPGFMTLTPHAQPFGADTIAATLRVEPGFDDAGVYNVPIHVSDGHDETIGTLRVIVHDVGVPETSLRLGPAGAIDYKYTAVDGRYLCLQSYDLRFAFNDTLGSGAYWFFDFFDTLAVGDYPTSSFRLFGQDTDTTARDLSICYGEGRYQIRKITRKGDGTITSFWATFQYPCNDGSTFHGDLRYRVPVPIVLVAPRWIPAGTDTSFAFQVTSSVFPDGPQTLTVSGLPDGAVFTDQSGGRGRLVWTATRDAIGDHIVRFIVRSENAVADTAYTTIHVQRTNQVPHAAVNGPYSGLVGVPILFSSAGSSDPDGDPLMFWWIFGDGGYGSGPSPSHTYSQIGSFPVDVYVTDGFVCDQCVYAETVATITWPDSASAVQVRAVGGSAPIQLTAGGGHFCIAIETVDAPSMIADIDPSSIRLVVHGLGSIDSAPVDTTSISFGDSNGNGIADARACFGSEALRALFSHVTGKVHAVAALQFALRNGNQFHATLPVDVVGPDCALRPLLAPNPLRPSGTFSFFTTVEGKAKLTLFDSHGRLVRRILDVPSLSTGYHDLPIDTRDAEGRTLPSGIYYYRLETKEAVRTGRLTLLR